MANVIWGIFVVILGAIGVYFSSHLAGVLGRNAWAERNLGGTRNAIVLFSLIVVVIGIMMMFGMLDSVGTNQVGL